MIDHRQLQAARILTGWSQSELAGASGVAVGTIQALESGTRDTRLSNVMAVLDALRQQGVEITGESERYIGGVVVVRGSAADWVRNAGRDSGPAGSGQDRRARTEGED